MSGFTGAAGDAATDQNGRIVACIGRIFQTVKWDEVLARIVSTTRSLFGADTASLILAHEDGSYRVALSEVDTAEGPKATGQVCGDGVATRVATRRLPMLIVGALERYEIFAG